MIRDSSGGNILQGISTSPLKIKSRPASAKAIVLDGNNRVLLLKKPNGKWDLPGGKLEIGEAWIDGLAREVKEETGLKINKAKWVAGWVKKTESKPVMKGVFLCPLSGKARKKRIAISDEHIKGEFFSLKKIKNLFLSEEYAEAIGLAARRVNA